MGDNPVDNKAVDILAAAAGVPTPAQAKSVWGTAWRYRKLALIVGGAGLVAAGGGYGYKHFTANPGKANAKDDPPAVAVKPDEARPPAAGEDTTAPGIRPPAAVKDEGPSTGSGIKVPAPVDIDLPPVKPVVAPAAPSDRTETNPPLLLPPTPTGDAKKPVTDDGPPAIQPPPTPDPTVPKADGKAKDPIKLPDMGPEIQLPPIAPPKPDAPSGGEVKAPTVPPPDGSPKKPAAGEDQFKSADPVPTIGTVKVGPGTLPAAVGGKSDKDDRGGLPVIRVQGVNPPAEPPKVEVPAAPAVTPPGGPKTDDPPAAPKIAPIDIPAPPAPPVDDKGPAVTAPGVTRPGPTPTVPPVQINPLQGGPEVNPSDPPTIKLPTIGAPEGPARPPVSIDPPVTIDPVKPPVGRPPAATKVDPPPVAPPARTETYDETWHEDKGETFAAISREYFHDPKYAAALEAYNRNRRDKIIRVPPTWVLKDRFPNLIREGPDKADKPAGGLKFEPVAPLPSGGRTAPAAATSRPTDEYKVTNESGEMIRDVARKALGDATAWKKLFDLNPGIDPTLPIPAGTTLRLK